MRLVVQRVLESSVSVDGELKASIGKGVNVLVGIDRYDTSEEAEYCARKLVNLKLWNGPDKTWAKSVKDLGLEVLLVSQFTLMANLKKGYKPDFHVAMKNDTSRDFFDDFVALVRKMLTAEQVKIGCFGEHMDVAIRNDGPVTIVMDTIELRGSPQKPSSPVSP
ncbi:MAG: hypothetical protein KVP17_004098 [Porospora cf. gigantea B]|uniref:uncharacterized protein n=1 Tax=Porospora cf. gigantea B TaxID=2853592 RepID=UPI0035719269|nr:MAG: hypothetical protein KVP17_004098 [Porospora cf. gigantea B]